MSTAKTEKPSWVKRHKILSVIIGLVILGCIISAITSGGGKPQATNDTNDNSTSTQDSTPKPTLSPADTKLSAALASFKQQYPTVNESYLITSDRDPDHGLGTSGYYNAGAAFCDTATQVQPSDSVTAGSADNAYGYSCGGVVEVYSNTKDVATRVTYFDNFKGNPELTQCQTVSGKEVCDYRAVGDVFLHISDQYPASQWASMLDYLSQQVQAQQL
ncbi:MAG TPA: hypothetical protein VLG16_04050 [Candidatus Saccharimonadales bacterium]|nr:hypothetical protein [Candidatus Saccharimonadales bacterium]